jgi:beta-N-acetylhexosaminidase
MSYGPVWIDLEGVSVSDQEIPLLQHKNTGGVLLFTKNFASKQQLIDLVKAIRDHAAKDLLIGVDHEGGRIWRFSEGFTCPSSAKAYGTLYEKDPTLAVKQLNAVGQTIANELLNCGIDLTFAPVLDLDHGVSSVIGDRSYHSDPQIATACARAFIEGLNEQGMGSVGKHFPGHGGCTMDSHFSMAVDERFIEDLEVKDLVPFAELAKLLTGIMPAHVIYPEVDPLPAGFSKYWLHDVLRRRLGFEGAIISDCLSMQGSGFTKKMVEGAELALMAGCDMVIATQQSRDYLLQVLEQLNWDMPKGSQQRIANLAGDFTNPNLVKKPQVLAAITAG